MSKGNSSRYKNGAGFVQKIFNAIFFFLLAKLCDNSFCRKNFIFKTLQLARPEAVSLKVTNEVMAYNPEH